MATVRKLPSGKWNAQVRIKGHPAASASFPSKVLADKWVKVIESEMVRHTYIDRTEGEATTLAEALDRYRKEITPSKKGASQEHCRITQWLLHPLANKPIAALKPSDFAKYRDNRIQVAAASTVRLELAIISHLFTIASKEWSISGLTNPIESIRKPKADNARDRRLNTDELSRLLDACKQSESYLLPYLVEFAIETGMRLGEILSLSWTMVDLQRQIITLHTSKNGDGRTVPLSSHAIHLLRSMPRDLLKNIPREFRSSPERQIFFTWKTHRGISKAWHTALKRAGITDYHFHDLRHEATTRFFEKGFNVMEVASITGHKTLQMLKRYTHLKATDLAVRLR